MYENDTRRREEAITSTVSTSTSTTVLLIRHAHTEAVGAWLAGRTADLSLDQVGRAQAERLRTRLSAVNLSAVYSSPLQRAIETAGPLARDRGLRVEPQLELIEVDFGDWSGQRLEHLEQDPRWVRFNEHRSSAAVPNGEPAVDVQARVVRLLETLVSRHPNQVVACVSHADVIRLAVLHLAGAPVDFIHRFEISPASVTAVALRRETPTLLYVNERDPLANHP